ncbi:MAG: AAA family ATPase, partial [Halanaerobiales bacterium]
MNEDLIDRIKENIAKVIVGKKDVIDLLMTALLAGGHILIDDVPGVGKTKLANSLASSLGCDFKRIQFTPDLQPADITGIYYYNQKEGEFLFREGPVMTNILLADEINRAVPRTQSSLLEAMEERQVTVEGDLFNIDDPFMVIATQNPVELEGTFPLPEAQLDRFLLKIGMGYPGRSEEADILQRFKVNDPLESLDSVVEGEQIIKMREKASNVFISDELLDYIVRLCRATRRDNRLRLGVSPRGSLAVMKCSLAYAYINGRDYVLPDDIQYLFPVATAHRLLLTDEAEMEDITKNEIIKDSQNSIEVP